MEAPEKIYVHEASAPELTDKLPYHIEYTRTDAFIEKACEWLRKCSHNYANSAHGKEYLVIDFKSYMKEK